MTGKSHAVAPDFDRTVFARLVADGVERGEAMTAAGYTGTNPRRAAAKALEDPAVLNLIRDEHHRFVTAEIGPVARREHKRLLEDPATPMTVKARLIAIAFEHALPTEAPAPAAEPELTLPEVRRQLAAVKQEIVRRQAARRLRSPDVIDVEPLPLSPAGELFE